MADRYAGPPLSVAASEAGYGAYLNALHFGEATLTFPQTIVLRYSQLEAPEKRIPQAVEDYARWTLGRLRAFDTWLGDAEYAAAGRFTMADISIGYALMMTKFVELWPKIPERLQVYFERLAARPAFARAKAAQGGDGIA